MADELARWARSARPSCSGAPRPRPSRRCARRCVEAALAQRERPSAARQRRAGRRRRARRGGRAAEAPGDALWAYCVARAGEPVPADAPGVDAGGAGRARRDGDLAALVSRVPLAEFGAEPLRRNLNDLAWLERVARAHEAVLERALAARTIVPLRLCTIYASEDGGAACSTSERDALARALEALAGARSGPSSCSSTPSGSRRRRARGARGRCDRGRLDARRRRRVHAAAAHERQVARRGRRARHRGRRATSHARLRTRRPTP